MGKIVRNYLLRMPIVTSILKLDEPGDAKYFYIDPKKGSTLVLLVSVNGEIVNENIEYWLEEMIDVTLGKNVIVSKKLNYEYPKKDFLTDEDLNMIREEVSSKNKADLYIIYTSSYALKKTSVGVVTNKDTIFIFRDAIENLSEKGYVKDILEKTTLMHEWGHLLGLDHLEEDGCIMSERVEVYDVFPLGVDLPTEYCQEEIEEIRRQF